MYYNGKYAEYSYQFKIEHACQLFERQAYNFLKYIVRNEENVEFYVHSKMYANGEFYYSMKVYNKNNDTLCSYELTNFYDYYSEDIYEDDILTYHKGQHDQNALIWDKKFFGMNMVTYNNNNLQKALNDYRLC